jgi:hypothetical protein
VSEWRKYRKDIKKRAKTAMETSRQLLVARARIAELEAAQGTAEVECRKALAQKDFEIEQLTVDRDSWKKLSGELADQLEETRQKAVRSAAKLLPMSIQQGRSG